MSPTHSNVGIVDIYGWCRWWWWWKWQSFKRSVIWSKDMQKRHALSYWEVKVTFMATAFQKWQHKTSEVAVINMIKGATLQAASKL
jgi:hypothetical protein